MYLTDEIRNEGLVRNLRGFSKFLDVVGLSNGEMVNANNIARDCAIDRSTVNSYFQILVDTLLGYNIYPYSVKKKRDLIKATPKFYLFDVGVASYLANEKVNRLQGSLAGKYFEHFILMELMAFISYHRKREEIFYWRTKTGLEVDFILGNAAAAIEVKISDGVKKSDLKGLISFSEEHPNCQALVVSQDKRKRVIQLSEDRTIMIYPWRVFLKELWAGSLLCL